jgi:hypothetical protein
MNPEALAKKNPLKQLAAELRNPKKLRAATLVAMSLVLLGAYAMLDSRIGLLRGQLRKEQERWALIEEVETLKAQEEGLKKRFPAEGTVTFWTAYLLGGVRETGITLLSLEPHPLEDKRFGRLQAVEIRMDVQGSYQDIYRLVAWIEAGKWPVRPVRMHLKSDKKGIVAEMTLAVLAEVKDS